MYRILGKDLVVNVERIITEQVEAWGYFIFGSTVLFWCGNKDLFYELWGCVLKSPRVYTVTELCNEK